MQRLAQIISIIFSPLTFMPLLLWLAVETVGTSDLKYLTLLIVVGSGILPSIVTLVYLKSTKQISDWGMLRREERYVFVSLVILYTLISLILLRLIGDFRVANFLNGLVLGGLCFLLITVFWKISAHTAAVTLFSLFITKWFGFSYVWVWLLIPILVWSRLVLKKHTFWQALAGIFLAVLLFQITRY